MKRLVVDIKDGYAAIAAGGEFDQKYIKIEFEETDFVGESGETKPLSSMGLFAMGDDYINGLYQAADQIMLVLPMRFSLVKPISVDSRAIEKLGEDFLNWEAKQQLPDELGDFVTGFYHLKKSFDNRSYKYLFFASSQDFVEVLSKFISPDIAKKPIIQSEAFGLFNAINMATDGQGPGVAISLEHDGVAVVIAHDNDYVAGKFIAGENPAIGEEIKYYIAANSPESTRPNLMICGDLDHMSYLGSVDWANLIPLPEAMNLTHERGADEPNIFVVAAGLNLAGGK